MNLNTQPSGATPAAGAAPTPPAPEVPPTPPTATTLAAPEPTPGPTNAELKAQLEAQNAQIAQLAQENAEQKKLARQVADRGVFVTLCQSGRSTPALEASELKVLGLLTTDEQRTAYLALRNEMPQLWTPGRVTTAELSRPGGSEDAEIARLRAAAGIKPEAATTAAGK